MKSLLTVLASLTVATAPGGDAPHLLHVELETAALSALPPTCFRTSAAASPAPGLDQGLTWAMRTDEAGRSVLELGAPSFVLGDAGPVTLPQQLPGSDARFSYQSFQARVEGASILTRQTAAEIVLTPGEEAWTGTLTLSARDGCRDGTCQLTCEVTLPFTATPVHLHLARAEQARLSESSGEWR